MQSLNTFIIEKRNLTELVMEMANYTNRAIMKKLEAIRNLVTISEQSYRKFADSDNDTRDATAKYMLVSSICRSWKWYEDFGMSLGTWLFKFEGFDQCDDQYYVWKFIGDYFNNNNNNDDDDGWW